MSHRARTPRALNRMLALCLALGGTPALAEEDLLDLPFEELARLQVSIATGTPRRLASAPATASVITAHDLEAMGARDIGEALETIPGLHASNGSVQYAPR